MTEKDIFESIYLNKKWGSTRNIFRRFLPKRLYSGPGSHDPKYIRPYRKFVRAWIKENGPFQSAVDLGCGDFAVGRYLQPYFERYIGIDISPSIIQQSSSIYTREGLEFKVMQGNDPDIPIVDIIFIRQVFQHLSNSDVQSILNNLTKKTKWIIITEDVHFDYEFNPNKDIPTGPGNRIDLNSGIKLGVPPFDFPVVKEEVICSVNHKYGKVITTCMKVSE